MCARPLLRLLPAIWLAALPSPIALGWGPEGHRVVARIAELHLSRDAAAAVARILGPGRRLPGVASIADDVRNQKTAPWHYVNIPVDGSYDPARHCPAGQCVIAAAERAREALKNPSADLRSAFEALYNLTHFIGDLHQPLHCGDRSDSGGNDLKVKLGGLRTNLHRVWDVHIPDIKPQDVEHLSRRLGRVAQAQRAAWSAGSPASWCLESHELSRNVVYRFRGTHEPVVLDAAYRRRGARVAQEQLAKAGLRLAAILNEIFR